MFQPAKACTTAVISGKYTKDGRPLLWKHRDTWALNNSIKKFDDGKYPYMGLVNSKDIEGKSVWIGFNSEGFAIMNSASYNLNNDTLKQSGLEGRIMKKALQTCSNIDDFEKLLNDLDLPTRLESNFGVIDAKGGAAYFELSNFKYEKIDANDPKIAPYGYLIRTNYSTTGKMGTGGGYIRYKTADDVFEMAVRENRLTPKTIIQECSRNLSHSLTKTDLNTYDNIQSNNKTYVCFEDYIPRKSTSSSVVIQGVKENKTTSLTTMWTSLGWPLASITIPLWLDEGIELPKICKFDNNLNDAPQCHFALEVKKLCYPYEWGHSSDRYMNINALINSDQTGILQLLTPIENKVFQKGNSLLDSWKENAADKEEIKNFYNWIDDTIPAFYKTYFNVSIPNKY